MIVTSCRKMSDLFSWIYRSIINKLNCSHLHHLPCTSAWLDVNFTSKSFISSYFFFKKDKDEKRKCWFSFWGSKSRPLDYYYFSWTNWAKRSNRHLIHRKRVKHAAIFQSTVRKKRNQHMYFGRVVHNQYESLHNYVATPRRRIWIGHHVNFHFLMANHDIVFLKTISSKLKYFSEFMSAARISQNYFSANLKIIKFSFSIPDYSLVHFID